MKYIKSIGILLLILLIALALGIGIKESYVKKDIANLCFLVSAGFFFLIAYLRSIIRTSMLRLFPLIGYSIFSLIFYFFGIIYFSRELVIELLIQDNIFNILFTLSLILAYLSLIINEIKNNYYGPNNYLD